MGVLEWLDLVVLVAIVEANLKTLWEDEVREDIHRCVDILLI